MPSRRRGSRRVSSSAPRSRRRPATTSVSLSRRPGGRSCSWRGLRWSRRARLRPFARCWSSSRRRCRSAAPESVPSDAAASVREMMEKVAEAVPAAAKSLVFLLRQAAVKHARDDFYRSIGRLRDEIERTTMALAVRRRRAPRIGIAACPRPGLLAEPHNPRRERSPCTRRPRGRILRRARRPSAAAGAGSARRRRHDRGGATRSIPTGHHRARGYRGRDRLRGRPRPSRVPRSGDSTGATTPRSRSGRPTDMGPRWRRSSLPAATRSAAWRPTRRSTITRSWRSTPHCTPRTSRARSPFSTPSKTASEWSTAHGAPARRLTACRARRAPATPPGALGSRWSRAPATEDRGRALSPRPPTPRASSPWARPTAAAARSLTTAAADPRRTDSHRPHLVAPGGDLGDELTSALVGGAFGAVGFGTGFAAPHVSGLVALLLERDPELIPTQHRDRLLAACTALSGAAEDEQGAGLVSPALVFPLSKLSPAARRRPSPRRHRRAGPPTSPGALRAASG